MARPNTDLFFNLSSYLSYVNPLLKPNYLPVIDGRKVQNDLSMPIQRVRDITRIGHDLIVFGGHIDKTPNYTYMLISPLFFGPGKRIPY